MKPSTTKAPLVSTLVACYNQKRFVVETLESVRAQTHPNIELIVTDAAVNIAQWAVGEKSSPGFWSLAVDPSRAAYASAVAPWIGALVPLLCSLALCRWYPRPPSPLV